jgi:alpha-2-macroglobulin
MRLLLSAQWISVRLRAGAALLVAFAATIGAQPALAQAQSQALRVVSAAPGGEVAALADANEIRVVFSEPMVALGRIPANVTAPFFRVSPAIPGSFRWSGTTILIFTPDAKRPLPYATKFEVTIDTNATAVSGRKLARPYRFSFTTPTVKLLNTNWHRRGGRAGAPIVVMLRFNQPVKPETLLPHLRAELTRHDWDVPSLAPEALAYLQSTDPSSIQRFNAKVAATRAATEATGAVAIRLTNDWDKKAFPPSRDLVVVETTTAVPSESWVRISVLPTAPSAAGTETSGTPSSYVIETEQAFFVDGFRCVKACAADLGNPLHFRVPVKSTTYATALRATDVTSPGRPATVARPKPAADAPREREIDDSEYFSLEDAGFDPQPPARTFAVTIDASLRSADGQTLGYTWAGVVENWHARAFTSFGDGHGVWERSGGKLLPFYARNFRSVTQWSQRVALPNLLPTMLQLQGGDENRTRPFSATPGGAGQQRRLNVTPDRIQSHGLDLTNALGESGTGLVWAAVQEGDAIEHADRVTEEGERVRATLVQVTNLGLSVKDSPQNTLVFVTRLDNAAPVAAARVSIVNRENRTVWTGTTNADGIAMAPKTAGLRDPHRWWRFAFVVTAEKDGDVGYVGSDWNEGITPWTFGVSFDLEQSEPMLRGTVFSDRGVYRLGEEVRFKAILRHNAPQGIRLLPAGTAVFVSVRDGEDRAVDERTVTVNGWSSAEWSVRLPAQGSLGSYSVRAVLESDRPKPKKPEELRPGEEPGPYADNHVSYLKSVHGNFMVAAYRRPDFRVDVKVASAAVKAGEQVKASVSARYLFGAPMPARPAEWTWTRSPGYGAPQAVYDALPDRDRWEFVGDVEERRDDAPVKSREAKTTRTGELALDLPTRLDAGIPYVYTLEADVEDVSRQHIANRASITVHPADWYIGVRRPGYFTEQKAGLKTELLAMSPAGQPVAGVPIEVKLTQVQWNSVRRAEGNGFYTWDTEKKLVPAGSWTVTSGDKPVPLDASLPAGGYFELVATAREASGRYAVTRTSFYAIGAGYTAWERYDHNRIDLVADKPRYKPGDTARIMIQSPWERATALVTTEREGIRSQRQFQLTSTQQSVSIPVTEDDIPNVYVSVLLVKGRSDVSAPAAETTPTGGPYAIEDPSDPGKPAFRLGYVELRVEDASKRLTVAVSANRQEYRPATDAQVRLRVTDHQGRPAQSEVTLWAVDYGVLSLTAYRTPDVLGSVYVPKALQVTNTDNRQRIISRRVLTPKGDTEGGGGGVDGSGTRSDFRVLAFWLGSVTTDASGEVTETVKLPESLTTYRIMAVAGDRASRFGRGEAEVRINKPLTMKPAFPRFLAVGDKALFGAVVTSQLREAGNATITIRSLDPALLTFDGAAEQTLPLTAGGSVEARFAAAAKAIGRARVQMSVRLGGETDAFEDVVPVEVLASPETVAAYGQLGAESARGAETVVIPASVVPGFGGLRVEMSSTAMVGLGEGARYLVEYPYGCAEQKGSRALAMLLAADLGDAFTLPGVETAKMRPAVQQTLKELELFQCPNGGFTYWPGQCQWTSAYLTSYLLHVFKVASDLKYDVDRSMQQRAYTYLDRELALPPPVNESWWPAYTAWQAFAVKVMVEGGRNQDSHLTRLYGYRERMPVFALAFLHDALIAKGEKSGDRVGDLRRRMTNAVLNEAGSAHVEELADPYLMWFWNSNARSTAIVLNSLVNAAASADEIRPMVRWMMAIRKNGRWGNTQENAYAMESLVSYYRRYESVVPDFTGVALLGDRPIAKETFTGRSTRSAVTELPMPHVLASAPAGSSQPLTFARDGAGTLFYTTRLHYAADELYQQGLDNGIRVERSFAPYVETGSRPAATAYKAGDLIRVTLTLRLTKERRYVAVTDPLPAGFEPLESWFATTARTMATANLNTGDSDASWESWWQRGGFDHVQRHDDRVELFATRLSEGRHEFSYVVRATTAGTFRTAPARAEEMYEPEIFGRTATAVITVQR